MDGQLTHSELTITVMGDRNSNVQSTHQICQVKNEKAVVACQSDVGQIAASGVSDKPDLILTVNSLAA